MSGADTSQPLKHFSLTLRGPIITNDLSGLQAWEHPPPPPQLPCRAQSCRKWGKNKAAELVPYPAAPVLCFFSSWLFSSFQPACPFSPSANSPAAFLSRRCLLSSYWWDACAISSANQEERAKWAQEKVATPQNRAGKAGDGKTEEIIFGAFVGKAALMKQWGGW